MKRFSEYDAFVLATGATNSPHNERVTYAALKLNGEAGEVAELVGKSMRAYNPDHADGGPIDPIKLLLELGDVLWYVARLAGLHTYSLEDVARVNREKLLRRKAVGKDPAGEREMAERTIATRHLVLRRCAWCQQETDVGSLTNTDRRYCSMYCEREAQDK